MPTSHHFQLNEIVDLIFRTRPRKMLDIGVGFGKYGFLAREYLELWNESGNYNRWQVQIDGIEAFEDYITPLQKQVYDTLFIGDALKIMPGMTEKYDLILLIDVLEHFTFEEGTRLLEECRRLSHNMIISVPKAMSVQEEVFGNPYEIHRYPWSRKELKKTGNVFFIYNIRSLICYSGVENKRLKKEIRNAGIRKNMIMLMDWLSVKKPLKIILGKK